MRFITKLYKQYFYYNYCHQRKLTNGHHLLSLIGASVAMVFLLILFAAIFFYGSYIIFEVYFDIELSNYKLFIIILAGIFVNFAVFNNSKFFKSIVDEFGECIHIQKRATRSVITVVLVAIMTFVIITLSAVALQ